jgi:hypothetical protein
MEGLVMNKLLAKMTIRLSTLFFKSALVNVNSSACLSSESSENEMHVCVPGSGLSSMHLSTHTHLTRVEGGDDVIPAGSHLVSPRAFYVHHGIYLGDGKVAHYSGLSGSLRPGPIEVTGLQQFANGRSIWIYQDQPAFSNDEIVARACSRMGESQYKILSNNCEHFCNWCINGTSYSAQVIEYIHCPLRVLRHILRQKTGLIA